MIYKHKFLVTVLSKESNLDGISLEGIADDIKGNGDDIGDFRHIEQVVVPPEKVREELLALGNDGSFFDEIE